MKVMYRENIHQSTLGSCNQHNIRYTTRAHHQRPNTSSASQ